MAVLRAANLALRFLLELFALVALGYWGFQTPTEMLAKFGLGIGVPLLAAVVWAVAISPRRTLPLSDTLAFALGMVVLLLAAAALAAAGRPQLAVAFAVVSAVNAVLLLVWNK